MGKFLLLKQAAKATGWSEWRLRQWCIEKKIRFNKAGNRYVINLDWLEEDLARMAEENIANSEEKTPRCGVLRRIGG